MHLNVVSLHRYVNQSISIQVVCIHRKKVFGLFRFIVGFIKSIEHTQMFVEFKKGENLAAAGDGVVFAVDARGNV